jgi:hypothetical protein
MTDVLKRISTSVTQFYDRFGLDVESVPPAQRRRYLAEEYQEFIEESVLMSDPSATSGSYARLAGEFADVLYTLIGVMQAHGFTQAELENAVEVICVKNDAKTPENGWKVVNNKVRYQPDSDDQLLNQIPF